MKFEKISIPKKILDINFKFYFFIKELNSSSLKIKDNDIKRLLEAHFANQSSSYEQIKVIFLNIVTATSKSSEKTIAFENLLFSITLVLYFH